MNIKIKNRDFKNVKKKHTYIASKNEQINLFLFFSLNFNCTNFRLIMIIILFFMIS